MFYFGSRIITVIRIGISEHAYTKGVPIDITHIKGATIIYVYVVDGKEYKAEMKTAVFYIIREHYTVMYMKTAPEASVLKEHIMATIIEDSILIIGFNTMLLIVLYGLINKKIRLGDIW